MIMDERQYKITRDWADRFQRALAEFDDSPREGIHPVLVKAQRDALESQLASLRAEIKEYERLKSVDSSGNSARSLDE